MKKKLLILVKAIFVVIVLSLAVGFYGQPAQAVSLLTNGSFEDLTGWSPPTRDTMILPLGSTTMTGWTVIGENVARQEIGWIGPGNPFSLSASKGSYFLDLTGDKDASPFGGVQQTVYLDAGQYQLTFDLGSSLTYGVPSGITAIAGTTTLSFTSPLTGNNVWTPCTMPFTVASSGSTIISLTGNAGHSYIGLDNVIVEASSVPIPPTALLLGTGLVGLLALRRRRKVSKS